MAGLGVIDVLGLAVALAFAVPIALFGVDQLAAGNAIGVAFLAIAVLLIAIEQWLTTPSDIPELIAERAVGVVTRRPDRD